MSFASLLNRRVTVQRGDLGEKDSHGNRPRTFENLDVDVPSRRELLEATEQIDGRDQQRATVLYFLPLLGPADVDLSVLIGQDRIVDVDGTYEIDGPPDVVDGIGSAHHLEVRAYRITG